MRRLTQFRTQITTRWDRMFVMGDPPDYEPEESSSIAAMAKRSNHTPDEVAYDYLAGGLDRFLFFPIVGYNEDNHDIIRTMLTSPETMLGLSDGGAHCSSISDASVPSWMLAHWGARPEARARPAAGADRQAADQRDGGLLRLRRPRPAGAGAEGRRQRDRLRTRCACTSRRSATTCRPAAGGWCSASTATSRRSSPARRCSSTANTPARHQAG